MIRLTINLPAFRRLDVKLTKRRKEDVDPIIPNLDKVFSARKGSKLSRFFKLVFENKRIKKVLGTNIAFLFIATTFVPNQSTIINSENVDPVIAVEEVKLNTEKGVRYPVGEIKISQGYKFYHPGIDFDGETGDPIYPILGGIVEAVDYSRYAYGNAVLINHGNGLTSLYAHLSRILVKKGDTVSISQIIAEMGSTGRSTGDHLHLEIRNEGIPINPMVILPKN